jgi:hypothetical protein
MKPSLHHVRVFGCKASVHVMTNRNKWDAKAVECVLVGYNSSSSNYALYIPKEGKYKHVTCHFGESSVAHPARHVSFMEEYESDKNDGLEIFIITEHTSLLNLRSEDENSMSLDDGGLVISLTPEESTVSCAQKV